jgi:hypothetical protein
MEFQPEVATCLRMALRLPILGDAWTMVRKAIEKGSRCRPTFVLLLAFCHFSLASPAQAEDFLRGDANGDGRVSYSDAFALMSYIFAETRDTIDAFTCLEALDVNDGGQWPDIAGIAAIIAYVFGLDVHIPEPFPSPGPDPNLGSEDTLSCESYGGPGPLEDPQAAVAIASAGAAGGGDTKARILIALSASTFAGAVYLELRLPPGLLDETAEDPIVTRIDRLPGPCNDALCRREPDGFLRLGYMLAQNDKDAIPACALRPVLEILTCLAPGPPAGEYPIAIEAAELTDFDSRRAIYPGRSGGVLTLTQDLPTDAVYTLAHLFTGGPAPPAPYPGAGLDPTPDGFHCLRAGGR